MNQPKKVHEVKVYQECYEPIIKGKKNFELRKNDRDYKVGDTLLLKEFNRHTGRLTGRQTERYITYVLRGGNFTLSSEYVILSIALTRRGKC
jgi:hypothetical protein